MYSKKVLTFNHRYTDWLIRYFRKNNTPIKVNSLLTTLIKLCDYFSNNFLGNQILLVTAFELDI